MIKRTIYIPEWLNSELEELAEKERRSFSSQALIMIERYINTYQTYLTPSWSKDAKWTKDLARNQYD